MALLRAGHLSDGRNPARFLCLAYFVPLSLNLDVKSSVLSRKILAPDHGEAILTSAAA